MGQWRLANYRNSLICFGILFTLSVTSSHFADWFTETCDLLPRHLPNRNLASRTLRVMSAICHLTARDVIHNILNTDNSLSCLDLLNRSGACKSRHSVPSSKQTTSNKQQTQPPENPGYRRSGRWSVLSNDRRVTKSSPKPRSKPRRQPWVCLLGSLSALQTLLLAAPHRPSTPLA
ncbi:hypothetical protein BZA70DRAFT_56844 [Myxozyma melibiosi]|uniref:Uncharacterized protein n=1 Tax=Myxozyma melibiosi TaxID=54550 RepID=A0ABR1FFK8_9ASCO